MNRKLYNDENYIVSEEFGRTFWFDTNNELMSAPTFKKGGFDKSQSCLLYTSPSPRDRG